MANGWPEPEAEAVRLGEEEVDLWTDHGDAEHPFVASAYEPGITLERLLKRLGAVDHAFSYSGAMALIAEVLSEGEIIDMQILATELSMTTLVEVHSVENLLKVRDHIGFPHAGYSLLGINNRDLSTMTTSIAHTFRLVELVENRDVLVSESGITSRDDLKRLREHGVNIALIGEYLMRQPDPGKALGRLLGENE